MVLAGVLVFIPVTAAAQILDPGDVDLSEVAATRNVDYLPDVEYQDGRDRLDIFMPKDARAVPVIVFFHGGALRLGDKIDGEALAARLVPEGIGVVSANYRLSPRFMHPAHVHDAAAAYAWTIQNIGRFGGDPASVFVSGHSAGGYLAALLTLDESNLRRYGVGFDVIRGAILISPFLYVEETARDRPKDVWGEDPVAWMKASVTPHIGPGKPPMLLVYADGDDEWRRGQNERFATAMRAAGNAVTVLQVSPRDHISLISRMNGSEDQICGAALAFIKAAGGGQ